MTLGWFRAPTNSPLLLGTLPGSARDVVSAKKHDDPTRTMFLKEKVLLLTRTMRLEAPWVTLCGSVWLFVGHTQRRIFTGRCRTLSRDSQCMFRVCALRAGCPCGSRCARKSVRLNFTNCAAFDCSAWSWQGSCTLRTMRCLSLLDTCRCLKGLSTHVLVKTCVWHCTTALRQNQCVCDTSARTTNFDSTSMAGKDVSFGTPACCRSLHRRVLCVSS